MVLRFFGVLEARIKGVVSFLSFYLSLELLNDKAVPLPAQTRECLKSCSFPMLTHNGNQTQKRLENIASISKKLSLFPLY